VGYADAGGYQQNKEIEHALERPREQSRTTSPHLAKLGVRDRTRAVLKALEAGAALPGRASQIPGPQACETRSTKTNPRRLRPG